MKVFLPAGLEVTFQVGQGSIVGGGGSDICIFGGGGSDICQYDHRYTLGDGTLSCLLHESKLTELLEWPLGGTSSEVLIIQFLPLPPPPPEFGGGLGQLYQYPPPKLILAVVAYNWFALLHSATPPTTQNRHPPPRVPSTAWSTLNLLWNEGQQCWRAQTGWMVINGRFWRPCNHHNWDRESKSEICVYKIFVYCLLGSGSHRHLYC